MKLDPLPSRSQPWKGFVGVAFGFNRRRCKWNDLLIAFAPHRDKSQCYSNKALPGLRTGRPAQPWNGIVGIVVCCRPRRSVCRASKPVEAII